MRELTEDESDWNNECKRQSDGWCWVHEHWPDDRAEDDGPALGSGSCSRCIDTGFVADRGLDGTIGPPPCPDCGRGDHTVGATSGRLDPNGIDLDGLLEFGPGIEPF
jgi:hypothetical protein